MTPHLARLGSAALVVALFVSPVAAAPAIEGYANYETYAAQVQALDASEVATVRSLGATLGGREIHLVTLGTGAVDDKPAILVVGNVHAPHLVGAELALRMARLITERAAADEPTKQLLERFTIYVIPRPAPDASEAFFASPSVERSANARPTDDDRDGQYDEDSADDLNGDGFVTMLRVADMAGDLIPHPDEPRILIQADPKKNEQGQFRSQAEGRDNDLDERFDEDGPGGVSFNKNLTFEYPYFEAGAGPHQVSEIETRAIADFCFERPNIAIVLTFTPEDNLFHPWKPNPQAEGQRIKTTILGSDSPFADYVAEQYKAIHAGQDAPSPPEGKGSFSEWAYFHYGRWSFAARGWWVPKVKPPEGQEAPKLTDERGADQINVLRWFEQQGIAAFVPWAAVEHPDFPGKTVEVGGFKPFLQLNPPAAELDPLADKHVAFIHKLAELAPRLAVEEIETEPLAGGVVRVTAKVANQGYLPTIPEMGQVNGVAYPVQLAFELPANVELVTGAPRARIERLTGKGARAERTWLLRRTDTQPATATIKAYAPAVGAASQTIDIP